MAPPDLFGDVAEAQALFIQARRRRRRRWLTGIGVAALVVAEVAASLAASIGLTPGRGSGGTRLPGAAPVAPSSVTAAWIDVAGLHTGAISLGGSVTGRVVAEVNADPLPLVRAGERVYWVDPAGTFVPALGHWSQVVKYLDVATGAIGTAGAGQTVFVSADGRGLFMAQTATTLTETPAGAVGPVRSLTLPRGWYLPGGDGLADLISGAGLATANGIVVQSQSSLSPDGQVLGLWNPGSARVTVIGRARAVIDAYTPPGARYSLLAWLPACRLPASCPIQIINTATLSVTTVRSRLPGGFAMGGAFSPAGTQLALFQNTDSASAAELALVDLATGTVRVTPEPRLALGIDIAWARWLPDGRHLVVGAASGDSYLVDAATLSARALVVRGHNSNGTPNYTTAIVPLPG